MSQEPFHLAEPAELNSAVLFASPHSGRHYPWDFLDRSILDERAIRSSEDAFVDQLFASVPRHGAAFLTANAPRAYVDLNRGADELDPALIKGLRHSHSNARVTSGLGVIPRVVSGGRAIYRGKITLGEAQRRLNSYWHPYHRALQALLDQRRARFGQAILIDCHSMPHEAVAGLASRNCSAPQVVLGDRFGASADSRIVEQVEAAFTRAGFITSRNTPFAGAYMAHHYGRPSRGQHVVQVEIDRALYMNEASIRPSANFHAVRDRLSDVIANLVDIGQGDIPVAAE